MVGGGGGVAGGCGVLHQSSAEHHKAEHAMGTLIHANGYFMNKSKMDSMLCHIDASHALVGHVVNKNRSEEHSSLQAIPCVVYTICCQYLREVGLAVDKRQRVCQQQAAFLRLSQVMSPCPFACAGAGFRLLSLFSGNKVGPVPVSTCASQQQK